MNYIKINLTCNNNNNILGCSMLLLLLLSYFKNTVSSSMLEKALLEDYFPSSSTSCNNDNAATTTFNYNFVSSETRSKWNSQSAKFEKDVFIAEMISSPNDNNQNQSWKIRVGSGGNIYSYFNNIYGEAMPPQIHEKGPFVDEVWQNVAVNNNLNKPADGKSYFIHNAGTYQKDADLLTKPFFSPNLAKHCHGDVCSFVSWGQQAHVPTTFNSSALYYYRYKDCGSGILEVTTIIHNAARVSDTTSYYNYLNVPWGGVRQSTFQDVFRAKKDGTGNEQLDPIGAWGSTREIATIKKLRDLGGYTTFVEDVPRTSNSYTLPTNLILKLGKNNPCVESKSHTASRGYYTVKCTLLATGTVLSGETSELQFTTPRGDTFSVNGVLHWSWQGTDWYFYPKGLKAADLNKILQTNDVLAVKYHDAGKRVEDNLALTFIHGVDKENTNLRVRTGTAGTIGSRNYIVYTVNAFGPIKPSESYYLRNYVLTDTFTKSHAKAKMFSNEVEQGMDLKKSGRKVTLYSKSDTFTFALGSDATTRGKLACDSNAILNACEGKTIPHNGAIPLYYVACGESYYVGTNPYHFEPKQGSEKYYRPYNSICNNLRPKWTLLGYFQDDNRCASIREAYKYYPSNTNFCLKHYPSPTTAPISPSPSSNGNELSSSAPNLQTTTTILATAMICSGIACCGLGTEFKSGKCLPSYNKLRETCNEEDYIDSGYKCGEISQSKKCIH
jgi:hypothetical protein